MTMLFLSAALGGAALWCIKYEKARLSHMLWGVSFGLAVGIMLFAQALTIKAGVAQVLQAIGWVLLKADG